MYSQSQLEESFRKSVRGGTWSPLVVVHHRIGDPSPLQANTARATDQAWLITARAVQGAGAAMAAPTALSLIAVTFPEGPRRTRAMAVYSAMAILGIVVRLIAGGLLVTYASWRWVMFVNVPIGLVVAALATPVLPGTGRRPCCGS